MKRYTFLVYHKQYVEFLEKLRELGVLHVIEKPEGVGEDDNLREKIELSGRIKIALKQLEHTLQKGAVLAPENKDVNGFELLTKIEIALSELDNLQQKEQLIIKERDSMEVWGAFNQERIKKLKNAGFELNFYSCATRKFDQEWEVLYNAFEIDTIGSTIYFVTVTRPGEPVEIDADQVKLNEKTAKELDVAISDIRLKIQNQKIYIEKLAVEEKNSLTYFQKNVFETIDFTKVVLNTHQEAEDKVMVLQGWVPEESENIINEYLEDENIFYETEIPTEEDKVPIKLKNNRFTKLYELIGELYDLPNYHELDLTPFFAPFYMLFFGLCLGDAGYGLIFVVAALLLRRKVSDALKPVLSLLIWLGASTVVMGAVSATFFGINLLNVDVSWIQSWKKFMLDPEKLFYSSLIIGAVQIMYGMVIKAFNQAKRYGFSASVSTWGWLIAILGMGATYGLSKTGHVDAEVAKYMYYGFGGVGGVLIFILNDIKRNPLINVGAGLWDAYNILLGLIGDILSYVRLFALGISGSVMGFVFNDLAMNLSGHIPVVRQLAMVLILLIGHGLNIFMSSLSAFVHPMRLTFVEFYKNAGFGGGGKKYRPFARYKEEKSLF